MKEYNNRDPIFFTRRKQESEEVTDTLVKKYNLNEGPYGLYHREKTDLELTTLNKDVIFQNLQR